MTFGFSQCVALSFFSPRLLSEFFNKTSLLSLNRMTVNLHIKYDVLWWILAVEHCEMKGNSPNAPAVSQSNCYLLSSWGIVHYTVHPICHTSSKYIFYPGDKAVYCHRRSHLNEKESSSKSEVKTSWNEMNMSKDLWIKDNMAMWNSSARSCLNRLCCHLRLNKAWIEKGRALYENIVYHLSVCHRWLAQLLHSLSHGLCRTLCMKSVS